jgi:hypothetical protein
VGNAKNSSKFLQKILHFNLSTFTVSDFANSTNYTLGGVEEVKLNEGWNMVSFVLDDLEERTVEVPITEGWNLIGSISC